MHVSSDESNTFMEDKVVCDDDNDILEVLMEDNAKEDSVEQLEHIEEIIQQDKNQSDLPQEWRTHHDHPIDNIISDINKGLSTRLNLKDACLNIAYVS